MIKFKQSPVVFNEEEHTYHLGNKQLFGITGLIHSVLGLGVYPDADPYVKDRLIPRAGSRGTAIHHAIQTYDEIGIKETAQIVHTRYGCHERDNIEYVDEEWDVTCELENYIRHQRGFTPLFNELTVSDNERYASQIDNGWLREATNGIWLVDTKSNNLDRYPLCGYFVPDYFTDHEEALKEYLSWQLSIYAVLFEAENPGMKVEGLACNWLRENNAAFWIIRRKPDKYVTELLKTDYVITDNGPIFMPRDLSEFGITTDAPVKTESMSPILPSDVVDYMAGLMKTAKEANAKLEEAKIALRNAMAVHAVKKYDFGEFSATLSSDTTSTSFDARSFKSDHPDLYNKYLKQTTRKGSLTLKLKDND